MAKTNQNGKRKMGAGSKIILLVALVVLAFSTYKLVSIYLEYKRGVDEYNKVGDLAMLQLDFGEPPFDIDFEALKEQNQDVIGWIYFPNLPINYPIMHSDSNNYYLKHTFEKEYNFAGSIFLEALNSPDFTDDNTLVYGHNMKNESMFGSLKRYKEKVVFDENSYFYIFTPEHGPRKYKIFSYYITRKTDSYVLSFENEDAKGKYLLDVLDKSMFDLQVPVERADELVMLVTCTSRVDDERFVFHAKLDKNWKWEKH